MSMFDIIKHGGIYMIFELQNRNLLVKADSIGAELKSIKRVNDSEDVEYLWQLNPKIWERQAPLLFPVIGRLKDEEYTYAGQTYKIGIHGFARFKDFTTERISDDEINFIFENDEETLIEFPFKFRLTVSYKLNSMDIIKSHKVENLGDSIMPYEVGGHEGYNLALFSDEQMEDYYLEFPDMNSLETYTADDNVMINKEKLSIELDNGKIYLSPEVFKKDALIMDEFVKNKIMLRNTKNDRGIDVEFNDFKYLGIWTKYMRSNYVCIEPWSSLPDCNFLGKELNKKQDVRLLEPKQSEKLSYTITVI